MRANKFEIRGLKCEQRNGRLVYFWVPPASLQKRRVFKHKTLGTNFEAAIIQAKHWNEKLKAYRASVNEIKPALSSIKPGTVGDLIRKFEASPRFARYALRTQQDYSWMYRSIETQLIDGNMFGEMRFSKVTRQMAYELYEHNVNLRGHDSANKAMCGWQSAFRYGMLKYPQIKYNPFSDLDRLSSPPRRQLWTDQQLYSFIKMAEQMGHPSVGRCALMCMELTQRPGDILSLKWSAYQESGRVWHIRQTKRGAVVRIPETRRLRTALRRARRLVQGGHGGSDQFVCATVTGKRWHRRNFTKTARRIARAAGVPDDIQIRDLRRTAATEGATAGATSAELMAVGGWADQASIRPYLVQTRQQAAAFQEKRDRYRRRQLPIC
jgi:integrase